jgi:hypothetical protein
MDEQQRELRDMIKIEKMKLESCQIKLDMLLKLCKHSIVKKHEFVVCEVCGDEFGWWCPESPDHACHYFSKYEGEEPNIRRVVVLRDGKEDSSFLKNKVPATRFESFDFCLYCSKPHERK